MLILTYMKGHPQNSDTQLLRYLISEVFDMFIGQDETDSEEPSLYQTILTYEAPWQMLHQMRDEIGAENYNNGPNHHLDPTARVLNNPPAVSGPTLKHYSSIENEKEHSQFYFLPSNSD